MFDGKWKFLVVSMIAYQAILTWCMFDLINTAAYLARTDCGDWCRNSLFGFILTNQGGYDTAVQFTAASVLLVTLNAAVWIAAALRKSGGGPGGSVDHPTRP